MFFIVVGVVVGFFIMGLVSDVNGGDVKYGFMVVMGFVVVFFVGLVYNYIKNFIKECLVEIEVSEYVN